MSRETVTRITTADTGKTYELPDKSAPQLWEIELSIGRVDRYSGIVGTRSKGNLIHVERQTFVNAGLMPVAKGDKKVTEETKETAEDLCLRLLEHLGVYPEERY